MQNNPFFPLKLRALSFLLVAPFFFLFFFGSSPLELPSEKEPRILYSSQSFHDLKKLYLTTFSKAQQQIVLHIYALTDAEAITSLSQQAEKGINTAVFYDLSGSGKAPQALSSKVKLEKVQSKGLMHQKICIIDSELLLIGTANLTPASLEMHDNLVVGLHSAKLAQFFLQQSELYTTAEVGKAQVAAYLLPDREDRALNAICKELFSAQNSICVAMFTFTHPTLVNALKSALKRGVAVTVCIDKTTAAGASQEAILELEKEGVKVYYSEGAQLLHHKWALIDGEKLIIGSANWTRSAFANNEDCFLILYNLTKKERHAMKKIWERLTHAPLLH